MSTVSTQHPQEQGRRPMTDEPHDDPEISPEEATRIAAEDEARLKLVAAAVTATKAPSGSADDSDSESLGSDLEKAWKRGLLLSAGIILGASVVFLTPLRDLLRAEEIGSLRERVLSLGAWAPIVFLAATTGLISLGAPRLILATLGGAVFGWALGTVLATIGTLGACLLTFTWVRAAAGRTIQRGLSRRLAKVGSLLESRGVLTVTLLRVVPIGSCHAMNILMALSPVRRRDFGWGTLFGVFPLTLSFALLGSGLSQGLLPHLLAAGIGIASLTISSILAMRKSRLAVLTSEQGDSFAESEPSP